MDQGDWARHGSWMDETLIGYARCSTDEQDLTAQRQALHAHGVPPDRVYIDHGISGTKRRRLMEVLDEHYVIARAEAVFNADPRRFATDTQANTHDMRQLLANGLPELDEREQLRIAAVIRCLVSSQAWLRMREEFGVNGAESGPVVAWVVETIIRELRAGNRPAAS